MGFHCPSCGREIYYRRRKNCEFCGTELPPSLRLSEAQLAYILNLKHTETRGQRKVIVRTVAKTEAQTS